MALPSVLLHDHLDGGLRPGTVLELAAEYGYEGLPSSTESGLASWFDQSESGSLETYLEAFEHTIGIMQTSQAIERVAHEAAQDLAADGVVYVESRFCPLLHTRSGLAASEHPIGALYRAGFNVTLNTDNRLISNTSMSKEFEFVEVHHGFDVSDLALTTKRGLAAAFCDYTTKVELWEETIAPAYIAAGANLNPVWR